MGLKEARQAVRDARAEYAKQDIRSTRHADRMRGVAEHAALAQSALDRRLAELRDLEAAARDEAQAAEASAAAAAEDARREHAAALSRAIDETLDPLAAEFVKLHDAPTAAKYVAAVQAVDARAVEEQSNVLALERVVAPLFRAEGAEAALGDVGNWFGRTDGGPRGVAGMTLHRMRTAWEKGQKISLAESRAYMSEIAVAVSSVVGLSRFPDAKRAAAILVGITQRDVGLAVDAYNRGAQS